MKHKIYVDDTQFGKFKLIRDYMKNNYQKDHWGNDTRWENSDVMDLLVESFVEYSRKMQGE